MEPLHPALRAALRAAHPGLTDEDIDRTEELLARRMMCDPQREPDRIADLDRQRLELIRLKMPRYADVARALSQTRRPPEPKSADVTVTLKTPR